LKEGVKSMNLKISTISLAEALALINTTLKIAEQQGMPVAVVVSDNTGQVLASARMDGVGVINLEAARRKAYTSAMLKAPTAALAGMTSGDPLLAAAFNGTEILALAGGAPLMEENACIGGIGIAGGHYSQDQMILEATLSR
jgi:glc operon protein GlcG